MPTLTSTRKRAPMARLCAFCGSRYHNVTSCPWKRPGWLFSMGEGFFTDSRWWLLCSGYHRTRRPGWPAATWSDRLPLTGRLMHRERRS